MLILHKKLIVDERGNPTDVVIPWPEFVEISELLGLDLDEAAIGDLRAAQADRRTGAPGSFLNFTVKNTPVGVLIKPKKPFPETKMEDGLGCVAYAGTPLTQEAIEELLAEDIRRALNAE